jgi:hypothetical protein
MSTNEYITPARTYRLFDAAGKRLFELTVYPKASRREPWLTNDVAAWQLRRSDAARSLREWRGTRRAQQPGQRWAIKTDHLSRHP